LVLGKWAQAWDVFGKARPSRDFTYSRKAGKLENLVLEIGSHARSGTQRDAVGNQPEAVVAAIRATIVAASDSVSKPG
jgi:hypothetical protein